MKMMAVPASTTLVHGAWSWNGHGHGRALFAEHAAHIIYYLHAFFIHYVLYLAD